MMLTMMMTPAPAAFPRKMFYRMLLLLIVLSVNCAFVPQTPQSPGTDWFEAELTIRKFPPSGPKSRLPVFEVFSLSIIHVSLLGFRGYIHS